MNPSDELVRVAMSIHLPTRAQLRTLRRDDASSRLVEQWFHLPIAVAALLAIPAIAIQLSVDSGWLLQLADVVSWMVWSVFVLELALALRTAARPVRWLATHPIEVLVVVLTPPFLGEMLLAVPYVGAVLRLTLLARVLLPILRLRKLVTISSVVYGCIFCLLLIVACGLAYPIVEPAARSAGADDGLWWAWITATTVGYGDVYPVSNAGRMLAAGTVLVGIMFVSLFTALIVEALVAGRLGPVPAGDAERLEGPAGPIPCGNDALGAAALATLERIERRLDALESSVRRG